VSDDVEVPDRALQSALEFAIGIASVGSRLRPALPFPAGLKPFLKFHKLPPASLGAARAAIEGDPEFHRRLGLVATAELIDEVGMLWLTRPEGWAHEAQRVLATAADERDLADEANDARREGRRREAAETAAARARLEVADLKDALTLEREQLLHVTRERDRLTKELAAAAARARDAEARLRRNDAGQQAVSDLADAVNEELASLRVELAAAQAARDAALTVRAGEVSMVEVERMRALLLEALSLTGGEVSAAKSTRRRPHARTPLAIPGGVYGNSGAAAEHLLRVPGVLVLVDGYNVAKLGWPALTLEHQRQRCIDVAESLARRWGTDLHVVFDGASVVGAHSSARRVVRVSYSPEGVLADDVLRAEVAALDAARPVVVVTNDQAVIVDVRAMGANVVASDIFLALAR
jgi:hypothetical protein